MENWRWIKIFISFNSQNKVISLLTIGQNICQSFRVPSIKVLHLICYLQWHFFIVYHFYPLMEKFRSTFTAIGSYQPRGMSKYKILILAFSFTDWKQEGGRKADQVSNQNCGQGGHTAPEWLLQQRRTGDRIKIALRLPENGHDHRQLLRDRVQLRLPVPGAPAARSAHQPSTAGSQSPDRQIAWPH